MTDRLSVAEITGVVETMLWPLHNRAAEARRPDARLEDPEAVRIADAIDYDYERSFGKPDFGHILRALVIDDALRAWLRDHTQGPIVALGEGLETQALRVDNGQVRWLSVDLPEAIEVRERFLPDTERHRNLRCSALDFRWMDEVTAGPDGEICVTMAGLLMYFDPEDVRRLISTIAGRFPRAVMLFDIIPRWLSRKTLSGWSPTPDYRAPPMPWGIDRNELDDIVGWHEHIVEVTQPDPPCWGRGLLFGFLAPVIERTPWLRNKLPTVARLRCDDRRDPA